MLEVDMESINKLLKIIVSLMVRRRNAECLSLKDQIKILNDLGLKPKEISEILGRTGTYVNKELVAIRKKGGKKNGKN